MLKGLNKKAKWHDNKMLIIIIFLVMLAVIEIITEIGRCRKIDSCGANAYCGSDARCHRFGIAGTTTERSYSGIALVFGVIIIISAIVLRKKML